MMIKMTVQEIQAKIAQKLARLRILREQAEAYQSIITQNSVLLEELVRTRETIRELIELKKKGVTSKKVFVRIGLGTFVATELPIPEKILLNIGADVLVLVPLADALALVTQTEEEVKNETMRVQNLLNGIIRLIEKEENEVLQLQQKLAQLSQHRKSISS